LNLIELIGIEAVGILVISLTLSTSHLVKPGQPPIF